MQGSLPFLIFKKTEIYKLQNHLRSHIYNVIKIKLSLRQIRIFISLNEPTIYLEYIVQLRQLKSIFKITAKKAS